MLPACGQKKLNPWTKGGFEGIYPFIDKERHLINFTPGGRGPGYFDAYYDGLLRLFAFMHLSGHYRVIEPK
ncbi:MAG: hypothetical protein IKX11_02590 [Bacteroidales bacterium]|nr:hypothetical protein [Bacteroidales bacterium]